MLVLVATLLKGCDREGQCPKDTLLGILVQEIQEVHKNCQSGGLQRIVVHFNEDFSLTLVILFVMVVNAVSAYC